jgi:hypothetical protein
MNMVLNKSVKLCKNIFLHWYNLFLYILYFSAGKFPTLVTHQESLEIKVNEIKATVKFQLKKVLCMGIAVGNCDMEEKQIFQNVTMSVNFLVSLLKKNWQNVCNSMSFYFCAKTDFVRISSIIH